MKRIILLLLFFASAFIVKADGQILHVWQSDGQVVSINLAEQPVTKYVDGNLVITSTRATITYPLEKVRKYTYTIQADGISSPKSIGVQLSADGETLDFKNLRPHTGIAVYSVSGQLLRKLSAPESGKVTVSCSQLPVGVYVVKVNGATYKISKR